MLILYLKPLRMVEDRSLHIPSSWTDERSSQQTKQWTRNWPFWNSFYFWFWFMGHSGQLDPRSLFAKKTMPSKLGFTSWYILWCNLDHFIYITKNMISSIIFKDTPMLVFCIHLDEKELKWPYDLYERRPKLVGHCLCLTLRYIYFSPFSM